ncbi:UNVERIFIED_CONTAM: hypothetical protein Slati_3806000 [Sesamum latifolium]|uniref:Uncharacterized protein n=1 Tax=Sesamum latifolium TaxID=2727402 RepID=A0AAW2U5S3_9LAMI
MGSIVPSYSAMAGVRQFKGSSSAMTASVKGTPCRSSSGAPSIWYLTSCRPFCRCSRRASHCGGTSGGSGRGISRLLPVVAQGLGLPPHPLPLELLPQVVELTVGGLLQTHALIGQPSRSVGWLQVMWAIVPPWRCQKTCFDDEGQL